MGEVIRVDFQNGCRLPDDRTEKYHRAKKVLGSVMSYGKQRGQSGAEIVAGDENRFSSDDRINAAATAIATTDKVHQVLEEGVHLAVDLGELYQRENEAMEGLSADEQQLAISLARGEQ